MRTPIVPEGMRSSWAQYTIALNSKEERVRIKSALNSIGVPTMIYYEKPLNKQMALKNALKMVELKNSECAASTVLSLPMHPFMEDNEVEFVVNAIGDFFKK